MCTFLLMGNIAKLHKEARFHQFSKQTEGHGITDLWPIAYNFAIRWVGPRLGSLGIAGFVEAKIDRVEDMTKLVNIPASLGRRLH